MNILAQKSKYLILKKNLDKEGVFLFNIGDAVFYPAYGVCIIDSIEKKIINGMNKSCYRVHLVNNPMTVTIPEDLAGKNNMRLVSDSQKIDSILERADYNKKDLNELLKCNYKIRKEEFIRKIKNGSVEEYMQVISSLTRLKCNHNLNSSERQILYRARKILIEEICISKHISKEEADRLLEKSMKLLP